MDKLIGLLVLLASVAVAAAAAVFSNDTLERIKLDELAHSKKVAKDTEEAFKKVLHQTIQESVDKAMGIKKSRNGNNARY